MNFSVGQVVYLLTKKDPNVYPALVCEEIHKRSLTGKTTSYVVRLPTKDSQEVELDKLDAEVFTGIDEARSEMISRATDQINFILGKAEEISSVFSEFVINESENLSENSSPDILIPEEYATVDLGDGQVARINVGEIDKMKGERDG